MTCEYVEFVFTSQDALLINKNMTWRVINKRKDHSNSKKGPSQRVNRMSTFMTENKRFARWASVRAFVVLFDIVAVNISYYATLLLRCFVNFQLIGRVEEHFDSFWTIAPFYTVFCIVVFACFKLYSGMRKYTGLNDLHRIVLATLITAVGYVLGSVLFVQQMSVSYYLLGAAIQMILITAARFSYRIYAAERTRVRKIRSNSPINVMIDGTGEAGRIVRRKIEKDSDSGVHIACILATHGKGGNGLIDGIPVFSDIEAVRENIAKYYVNCVTLANSIMTQETRKQIRAICKELEIGVQDYSGNFQMGNDSLNFRKLMEVTEGEAFIEIEGKQQRYDNAEAAYIAVNDQYDIKEICSEGDSLIVSLKKRSFEINCEKENWIKKFEKETGTVISFF